MDSPWCSLLLGAGQAAQVFDRVVAHPLHELIEHPVAAAHVATADPEHVLGVDDVLAAGGEDRGAAPMLTHAGSAPDRKSTRLNSSHQIISYAVFCLKKKKTNTAKRGR